MNASPDTEAKENKRIIHFYNELPIHVDCASTWLTLGFHDATGNEMPCQPHHEGGEAGIVELGAAGLRKMLVTGMVPNAMDGATVLLLLLVVVELLRPNGLTEIAALGAAMGTGTARIVGARTGARTGAAVTGASVGRRVGRGVGARVGDREGVVLGALVGTPEGTVLGASDGTDEGATVG